MGMLLIRELNVNGCSNPGYQVNRSKLASIAGYIQKVAHTVFGVRHHNAHDFLPRMGRTIADTPFEKEQRDVMGDSNIPEDCG